MKTWCVALLCFACGCVSHVSPRQPTASVEPASPFKSPPGSRVLSYRVSESGQSAEGQSYRVGEGGIMVELGKLPSVNLAGLHPEQWSDAITKAIRKQRLKYDRVIISFPSSVGGDVPLSSDEYISYWRRTHQKE